MNESVNQQANNIQLESIEEEKAPINVRNDSLLSKPTQKPVPMLSEEKGEELSQVNLRSNNEDSLTQHAKLSGPTRVDQQIDQPVATLLTIEQFQKNNEKLSI